MVVTYRMNLSANPSYSSLEILIGGGIVAPHTVLFQITEFLKFLEELVFFLRCEFWQFFYSHLLNFLQGFPVTRCTIYNVDVQQRLLLGDV